MFAHRPRVHQVAVKVSCAAHSHIRVDQCHVRSRLVSSTHQIEAISEVLEAADKLLSAVSCCSPMRSYREEEYDRLWSEAAARLAARITPHEGLGRH